MRLSGRTFFIGSLGLLIPGALPAAPSARDAPPLFTAQQKAFWAFQPVRRPPAPAVRDRSWPRTEIDAFVLARLEGAGIRPAPPAGRQALLRRLTFDLTGLPPTPAESAAFAADRSPGALERVVDRLLASPHYGERWARHWLDAVRFAETTANDANAVMRYAWRYRDYVVRSLNRDLPYDRFLVEQLAGDLLPRTGDLDRDADQVIATGFLMIGPKALAETDKEQSRRDIIDDQIDTTGRVFLGLTLGCARCHDHKYDPFPTADYYALAGIFRGAEPFRDESRNATMWHEWPLPERPGEPLIVMAPRENRAVTLPIALRGDHHSPGSPALRRFPQILAGEGAPPLDTPQSGRLELARWIASAENPLTSRVIVNRVWQHHFGTGLVATSDNLGFRGERPSHPELLDWLAERFVRDGWSLKKLHRRILLSAVYSVSCAATGEGLARDPANRLLGRANRRRLDAETLRDSLLAVSGRLDRRVGGGESGELLFQEGEVIDKSRDYFRPNRIQADHPVFITSRRRSLYLPVIRNAAPDIFALFDGADSNGVTAVRNDTTVASQALFLLNHPFVREQAHHFARRLLELPGEDAARVSAAYRDALGREPDAAESEQVRRYLDAHQALPGPGTLEARRLEAWQGFCQTLFCRNEFLYVE